MRHSRKKAFTLVELLVVISIIGMLMSLLLPAVQSAREAGRANTCRNNLKNLALAMRNFDGSQNRLPGFINKVGLDPDLMSIEAGDGGRSLRASWFVMLLPYLEEEIIWESWSQKHDPVVSSIGIANCPSDPSEFVGDPTLSYVVNTGEHYEDRDGNGNTVDRSGNRAANGLFFDNCSLEPDAYPDPRNSDRAIKMSLAFVESNDGATGTLMMSENIHTLFWAYDDQGFDPPPSMPQGSPRAVGAVDDQGMLLDYQHYFGFFWRNERMLYPINGTDVPVNRINATKQVSSFERMDEFPQEFGYPTSNHPGVVQAAFCDGRVQPLRESIDAAVYRQLMTTKRKSSNVIPDEKNLIVDSSDL